MQPGASRPSVNFPVGGEVEIGENDLARPQQLHFRRLRLLDLEIMSARPYTSCGPATSSAPWRRYSWSVNPEPSPAPVSTRTLVAGPGQFLDAHRQHADAIFVRLDFLGHADDHDKLLRVSKTKGGHPSHRNVYAKAEMAKEGTPGGPGLVCRVKLR